MKWVLLGLAIICLPFIVYVLSKVATLGRLHATKEFARRYFNHKLEEENNGKEEE